MNTMTRHARTAGALFSLVVAAGAAPGLAQGPPVEGSGPARIPANPLIPLTEENKRKLDRLAEEARANPDDAVALATYGLALVRTGRTDDGLAALTRALVKSPDEPKVNLLHSKALWKAGLSNEAVTAALKVVESPLASEKDRSEAYFVAGTVESMQGDFDTAEQYFDKSIENNRQNVGALMNLGLMLITRQRIAEGTSYLEKAGIAGPDNPKVHATIAQVSERFGQVQRALRAWERTARLVPNDPQVQLRFGGALMREGRHEDAANVLAKVVELVPDNGLYRLAYGEALLRLRRYEEAEIQAREAEALGTSAASLTGAISFEREQFYSPAEAKGQQDPD